MQNVEQSLRSVSVGGEALKVLFLEPQPCIRALKYAAALKQGLGNRISLFFGYLGYPLSKLYGFGDDLFDRVQLLDQEKVHEDLRRIVGKFKPHIIHSHNAPDSLTLAALDIAENVPVIHDVHEVLSIHDSGFFMGDNEEKMVKYQENEKKACEKSDGRIYSTDGIKEYIQRKYDVDAQKDTVFYNYPLESAMPRFFKRKLSHDDNETHIVYIGCITSVVKGSHYDLRETFLNIAGQGVHIHVYPTINDITQSNETYKKLAQSSRFIHFHKTLSHSRLLHEITKYDFGWAGLNNVKNKTHLGLALPNKVLEYVSSGLPVLAFPHNTIQHFVEKFGIGSIIRNLDELPEVIKEVGITGIRNQVKKVRHELTIESKIHNLVGFYDKIAGF